MAHQDNYDFHFSFFLSACSNCWFVSLSSWFISESHFSSAMKQLHASAGPQHQAEVGHSFWPKGEGRGKGQPEIMKGGSYYRGATMEPGKASGPSSSALTLLSTPGSNQGNVKPPSLCSPSAISACCLNS